MTKPRRERRKREDRRVGARRDTALVPDWRGAHRWLSVQIMALIAASQGLLLFVPTVREYLPDYLVHTFMAVLAVLAIFGRLINQGKQNADNSR
jgi:hypothetical protein